MGDPAAAFQLKRILMNETVPHLWKTTSEEMPEGVVHLAMCKKGAVQVYLLHHGLSQYSGEIKVQDLGPVEQVPSLQCCFRPHCITYGLSFPQEEGEGDDY